MISTQHDIEKIINPVLPDKAYNIKRGESISEKISSGEININTIAPLLKDNSLIDFFSYTRAKYLSHHRLAEKPAFNKTLEDIMNAVGKRLKRSANELWSSQEFQLLFRATTAEHLALLGLSEHVESVRQVIASGRIMSILPYNLLMSPMTIKKYIPTRSEKFSGNWRHSMDPYGLFRKMTKVVAIDKNGNEIYLGTRKFDYAVLANITEACYIGCDGCYKGSMVRTSLAALEKIYPEYAKIKKQLTLEENKAVIQARLLTSWLNKHPEVDTIVISGGEPTLFSNETLRKIVAEYKKAEHVKVLRMCTSSVFQGMWYRIDDELVDIFYDYEKSTGKQFYINAHVTDEFQLGAPEAKIAIDKLARRGISVHLQLPVQQGINFLRDDLAWSTEKLKRISQQAYYRDVDPYKLIIDMHSPSHSDITVPLEDFSKVISALDSHQQNSDHWRFRAPNLLTPQGNDYIYPYPHFSAYKEIDKKAGKVTYFIPKVSYSPRSIIVHTYEEPLLPGHNDDKHSLNKISNKDINKKIKEVVRAYHTLTSDINRLERTNLSKEQKSREAEQLESRFFQIAGIECSTNEPLILNESFESVYSAAKNKK